MKDDIHGLLVDLDGVLYVGEEVLPGRCEAVANLRDAGVAMRFLTNTTTRTVDSVLRNLKRLGFDVATEKGLSMDIGVFVAGRRSLVCAVCLCKSESVTRDASSRPALSMVSRRRRGRN